MIEIDIDYFEHLLNCLVNQKYMPIPGEDQSEREAKDQEIIDLAWQKGMDLFLGSN